MKITKTQKGITLIALIITIVILLVLAVVAIGTVSGEDGIIKRAQQTRFFSDVGKYKEELELYKSNWEIEYRLNKGQVTDEITNANQINEKGYKKIKEKYIPSFAQKYEGKLFIEAGELVYQDSGNITESEWAAQLGLEIRSEYATIILETQGLGTVSSDLLVDGQISAKVGQTITIVAVPGSIGEGEETVESTFAGWYKNGILVFPESNYTFKVTGGQKLTAVFETDATLIYYSENGEEKVLLDSTPDLSKYATSGIDKTKITKVEFGTNCTSIGTSAFEGCTKLESIKLPANLKIIGESAFYNCTALTTITADTTNTLNIGRYAFRYCTNLESATFTNVNVGLARIFANCTKLKRLQLGKPGQGVSGLGGTIVDKTDDTQNNKLEVIIYLSDTTKRIEESETNATIYYYNENEELIDVRWGKYYSGDTSVESVNIPDATTEIIASAFEGCTKLESIKLPANLKIIGENAFKNCSSLQTLVIPSTCTNIGESAFYSCTALTTITADTTNTLNIGRYAFRYCTNLDSATFTNVNVGVARIFANCTKLRRLQLGKPGLGVSTIGGLFLLEHTQNNELEVKIYLSDTTKRIDTTGMSGMVYYYDEAGNEIARYPEVQ